MPFRRLAGKHHFQAVGLFENDVVDTGRAHLYAAICPVCVSKYRVFVTNNVQ